MKTKAAETKPFVGNINIVPVDTLRTKSGALRSLARILGEKEAMPVALDATDKPLDSGFRISGTELSLSIAAKLNISGLFDGSYIQNERAYLLDAAAFLDKYREDSIAPGVMAMTRWGVGFRVAMRASDIQGGLKLSYGTVAAAVDLGLAKARYEIVGVGIGIDVLVKILKNVSLAGQLNGENFFKLANEVPKIIAEYIEANKASLVAQPMAAGIVRDLDSDRIETARSIFFAMYCLSKPWPLKTALERAMATLDKDLIRFTYAMIAGNIPETQTPDSDAEEKADKWLRTS